MNAQRHGDELQRAVEALGQALYEAQDPGGIPWVKRPRVIRDPWLALARQQLAAGPEQVGPEQG